MYRSIGIIEQGIKTIRARGTEDCGNAVLYTVDMKSNTAVELLFISWNAEDPSAFQAKGEAISHIRAEFPSAEVGELRPGFEIISYAELTSPARLAAAPRATRPRPSRECQACGAPHAECYAEYLNEYLCEHCSEWSEYHEDYLWEPDMVFSKIANDVVIRDQCAKMNGDYIPLTHPYFDEWVKQASAEEKASLFRRKVRRIFRTIKSWRNEIRHSIKSFRAVRSGFVRFETKFLEGDEWVWHEADFDVDEEFYICAAYQNGRHIPLPILEDWEHGKHRLQKFAIRMARVIDIPQFREVR